MDDQIPPPEPTPEPPSVPTPPSAPLPPVFQAGTPVPGEYPPDRTWGIVIGVISILGICVGGCVTLGGGAVGVLGGTAAAAAAAAGKNADSASTAAVAAAGGGLLVLFGIATIVISVVRAYGGFLMMKSKRLGFLLAGGTSALGVLIAVANMRYGILGAIISAIFLYYCYMRLSGKQGPPVVD